MTPFSTDFIKGTYVALMDSAHAVTLGDSTTKLTILGKGSVERWVETAPHQFHSTTLNAVLHVRGIHRCFLSPGRLNNKGWTISLTPANHFSIEKGSTHYHSQCIGSLYNVNMYAEPPPGSTTLNVVQALPIKIWHEGMGHTHWEALK